MKTLQLQASVEVIPFTVNCVSGLHFSVKLIQGKMGKFQVFLLSHFNPLVFLFKHDRNSKNSHIVFIRTEIIDNFYITN